MTNMRCGYFVKRKTYARIAYTYSVYVEEMQSFQFK